MDQSIERDLGELSARMNAVEQGLKELRDDVREIRDVVTSFRGSWKAVTVLIGMSASTGALAAKLLPFIDITKLITRS